MAENEIKSINGRNVCDQTARDTVNNITVPTKTSDLTNDNGFATETYVTSKIDDTATATNKTWSSSKIDSQIKNIENEMENIGKPTDEQVATVINQAIANGEIVAGGLTSTAKTLLINILRNAVYTSDQSANITALESALNNGIGGGSDTKQYTITNTLSNASTSNTAVLVDENASYTATITVNNGYELNAITVTMGGTDITSTAVSGTTITISAVTGNVVITVTTTATSSGGAGGNMITDGLVNYFDFRSASYNNNGTGGSTIIEATQGNGSLFTWATNKVEAQDDYGMTISRTFFYNANSIGTTDTKIKDTFTVAFLGYVKNSTQLFGAWAGYTNIAPAIYLKSSYINTSDSNITVTAETYITSDLPTLPGYRSLILTADATTGIAKMYLGGTLIKTYTGSDYSDFKAWVVTTIAVSQAEQVKATSMIVYDRVLSDVEIIDTVDFFRTMEVK